MRVYHYTNDLAYRSMQTKGIDGFLTDNFDEFRGIIPSRRFIRFGRGSNLPKEAYDGVIEGLTEPEPNCWLNNPEFPQLWNYLMHDVCREKKVLLLSFELLPSDSAFIVDRANIERELYREGKGLGKSTKQTMDLACKNYFDSRISALNYLGGYDLPQLAIWSGIEFERLKVEWTRDTKEVWEKVKINKRNHGKN
jgi:hypothetical protein